MTRKTNLFRLFALILLFSLGAASCASNSSLKGAVYQKETPAAEIKLTDHRGQPFQLTSLRGKVVLVFFGFSNCTTECPATLAIIRQALETTALTSQDVQVVMVSTDIERDTPASMQDFMERFSPTFLGLLGSPTDLEKTWQDYNVTVLDGGETHSSFTYVVDKKGNLRETFTPDTSPDDLASDLRLLTNEK